MASGNPDQTTRKSFRGINGEERLRFSSNDENRNYGRRLLQPTYFATKKHCDKEMDVPLLQFSSEQISTKISKTEKKNSFDQFRPSKSSHMHELFRKTSNRDYYSDFKMKSRKDVRLTKSPRQKKVPAKWNPEVTETDVIFGIEHLEIADQKVIPESVKSRIKPEQKEIGPKKTSKSKKPISPLNDSGYYSSSPRSRKSPNEILLQTFQMDLKQSNQLESINKSRSQVSVLDDLIDQTKTLFRVGSKQKCDPILQNLEFVSLSDRFDIRQKLENVVKAELNKLVVSKTFSVTLTSNHTDGGYVFIILCSQYTFLTKASQCWMKYCIKEHVKMESKEAIFYEQGQSISESKINTLEEFVQNHLQTSVFEDLFDRHSNLNMISFSKVKSSNYGSPNWVLTDELCVVLHCFHKGYIPFGENPFPKKIGDYRTDVREGYCDFSTKPKVQMGRSVYTESNQMSSSVGNFVHLEDGSVGFITCAHALFTMSELQNISSFKGYRKFEFYDTETREKIGHVVDVSFEYNTAESVDTALVKLYSNTDIVPGFPTINMDQLQHAGFLFQPFDISSLTQEIGYMNKKCYVVKYGAESKFTVGTLELGFASSKLFNWDFQENLASASTEHDSSKRFIMYNQVLINPLDNQPFLQQGDSGSFVFMVDDTDKTLKCIGMLIGQTSCGQGIMTPIHRILKKLKLKELKSFGNVKLQTTFSNPMMEMFSQMQLSMKSIHDKIDSIDGRVSNINSRVSKIDSRVSTLEHESLRARTEQMDIS